MGRKSRSRLPSGRAQGEPVAAPRAVGRIPAPHSKTGGRLAVGAVCGLLVLAIFLIYSQNAAARLRQL